MTTQKTLVLAFIGFFTFLTSTAQVGIGTTTPDASSALDVDSTTQGFLPPRMTNAERDAIASPAQGLMIYCTNCGSNGELQVYNGVAWNNMVGASISSGPPILTTTAITAITAGSATSGGNITSDDGSAITARGVCWSLSPNPTVPSPNSTTDGTGTGSYSSDLTDLLPGSTYYLRAYATNAAGTAYGHELSFTTSNLSIGDAYQGGLVFHLDGNGGGLIVSMSYVSGTTATWSLSGSTTIIGTSTGTAIGTGEANTDAIIAAYGNTGSYAAKACRDYNGGGYTDWFLPSIDELIAVRQNQASYTDPGFTAFINNSISYHWTSTEWSNSPGSFANSLIWNIGAINAGTTKTDGRYVRAIRSFTGPTAQEQLNAGATPKQLFDNGVPLNSIIGTAYQGGLIAHLNTTDGTGLIVSMSYVSGTAAPWSLSGSTAVIGTSSGTAIGTGEANTDAIIAAYGNTGSYAAKACRDYNGGGYTDWFLPSIDELVAVRQNRASYTDPGFTAFINNAVSYHWTSTEWSNSPGSFANSLFWNIGAINAGTTKTDGRYVRAVRSF